MYGNVDALIVQLIQILSAHSSKRAADGSYYNHQMLCAHARLPVPAVRNYISSGQSKVLGLTTHQLGMHKDHSMLPMFLTSESCDWVWAADSCRQSDNTQCIYC